VANNNSNLRGDEFAFEILVGEVSEDSAMRRWASVGGLKEESRMWRVLGGDLGSGDALECVLDFDTFCEVDGSEPKILNVDLDKAKEERMVR
jgi:hypothetical protein